jgi:hypothetical protein
VAGAGKLDQHESFESPVPELTKAQYMSPIELNKQFSTGEVVAGKFKIISLIGAGGYGAVYRVQHLMLRSECAYIVRSVDFGLIDNVQPYMVMEYIQGQDLATFLKERVRITFETVMQILVPLCSALSYAHENGIVHRDIKPHFEFNCVHNKNKPVVVLSIRPVKEQPVKFDNLAYIRVFRLALDFLQDTGSLRSARSRFSNYLMNTLMR